MPESQDPPKTEDEADEILLPWDEEELDKVLDELFPKAHE